MGNMFINPLPGASIDGYAFFDLPVGVSATNYPQNLGVPSSHFSDAYGPLGTPERAQGHVLIKEVTHCPGDPMANDQIVHISTPVRICHTGRLTGTIVKEWLINPNKEARIKFYAYSHTPGMDTNTKILGIKTIPLWPLGDGTLPDKWFLTVDNEYVCTACLDFTPDQLPDPDKLQRGALYNLVVEWEFYDKTDPNNEVKLPFVGYDDEISFKVDVV